MPKLDSLIKEIGALEGSLEKTASKSSSRLASFLDKIAEEAEKDESGEADKKDEKDENEDCKKEGSMKDSDVMKIARAIKTAVLDNANTQGSTVQVGPKSNDGAATNAARDTDQLISGAEVEAKAESNPERHNTSTSSDLIEDEPVNEKDMAKALKEGRLLLYTDKEAAILNKFASVGYNYIVETYSDQIVQEKVAEQIIANEAAKAPQKLANAYAQSQAAEQEKTAAAIQAIQNAAYQNAYAKTAAAKAQENATVQKLAAIKRNDPALFASLKTLANRGLI